MSSSPLGRLTRIDLREVWTSEPADFTPWLAREENIRLLGDAIGLELEVVQQEQAVGPFRADIVCKDTTTDQNVLIENQLERTDHTHLGQLLTYAAGLKAVSIVWIAQRFTEEHRAALDWLNDRTAEGINFFGLEIELWRIGDSPIAPKFNVVSQPNQWARTAREATSGDVSEHQQLQHRFWIGFRDYLEQQSSALRTQRPGPRHWIHHTIGRSGFVLASVVSSWSSETNERTPEIRAELTLNGPRAKAQFAALLDRRREIEAQLGFALTWNNPEDRNMCRIFARRDADFTDEARWPEQYEWLRTKQEAMAQCFAPIVRTLP
jgi:hypothetical protein